MTSSASCSMHSSQELQHPVVYYVSREYVALCSKFERESLRAAMVHGLVNAYGLLNRMHVCVPPLADVSDLLAFHSSDYVDILRRLDDPQIDHERAEHELAEHDFGFGYDCPLRPGIFKYVSMVAGASLDAVRKLAAGEAKVAINWGGGWHHARQAQANGYCYVNDCVLAILAMRQAGFQRVLYIDIDVHHGDAVQDAFYSTDKVFTLSVHKYEPGFYPGTGSIKETGQGRGKGYCCNIPLFEGLVDEQFCRVVVDEVFQRIRLAFIPDAILFQAGADALSGDPTRGFNLTEKSYIYGLKAVLDWDVPTLVLGGGGYHAANTARCWTALTAAACERKDAKAELLSRDIPEHAFFGKYGPDYELNVNELRLKNYNSDESLNKILKEALSVIDDLLLKAY